MSILYQLPPPMGTNPMDFWQGLTTVLEKYGIETLAILVALYLILRAVPGFIKSIADVLQTRAKAAATEQVGQVQNDAKVLDILQQQVNVGAEVNKILLQNQIESSQWREAVTHGNQINERLEVAIKEFNIETKALRMDVKNWPNTVDGTLAGLITTVDTMRVSFDTLQKNSGEEHAKVLELLTDVHFKVGVMYKLVMRPTPPTEPSSAPPAPNVTPLHADGAQANATVESKVDAA